MRTKCPFCPSLLPDWALSRPAGTCYNLNLACLPKILVLKVLTQGRRWNHGEIRPSGWSLGVLEGDRGTLALSLSLASWPRRFSSPHTSAVMDHMTKTMGPRDHGLKLPNCESK